jgi:hypothetical protein
MKNLAAIEHALRVANGLASEHICLLEFGESGGMLTWQYALLEPAEREVICSLVKAMTNRQSNQPQGETNES